MVEGLQEQLVVVGGGARGLEPPAVFAVPAASVAGRCSPLERVAEQLVKQDEAIRSGTDEIVSLGVDGGPASHAGSHP